VTPSQARVKFSVGDQLVGHFARETAGIAKPMPVAQSANHGVDADDFAVNVHERTAAVAGVDVRVGLDEILVHVRTAYVIGYYVRAALGADVAERDAVIEIERRADGDGKFTHARLRGVRKFRHG